MAGYPPPPNSGVPPGGPAGSGPPGYGPQGYGPQGYGPQGYGPQGYGPRGPSDDHLWALLSYLLVFVASFIAPLVIYLVKMNESRYVRYHAAQSLNMAITGGIYAIGGVVIGLLLAIATHGFALLVLVPLFIAYGVAHLVFLIIAAIAANRGELYRVPTVICLPIVH